MQIVNSVILILVLAMPWLSGAALAAMFASMTPILGRSYGVHSLSVGIGGYFGSIATPYLFFNLTDYCSGRFGPLLFALSLASIAILCFISFEITKSAGNFTRTRNPCVLFLLMPLSVVTLLFFGNLYHHALLPLQAWDALGPWANQALGIIQSCDNEVLGNSPALATFHHPKTVAFILAWCGWWGQQYNASLMMLVPWLFLLMSICCVAFGYVLVLGGSLSAAFLLVLCSLMLPLVENHALLGGYAELFLGVAIMGSCAVIAIGLEKSSMRLCVVGATMCCSSLFLKNIGAVYSLAPIFALISFYFWRIKRAYFMGVVILLILCLGTLWEGSYWFFIFGDRWGFNSETGHIYFGGRWLLLTKTSVADIFQNEWYSLVNNTSYSVIFLTFCVIFTFGLKSMGYDGKFLMLSVLYTILFLIASQFTAYGFEHAVPSSDTGNSRFTLPSALLTILVMGSGLVKLRRGAYGYAKFSGA